MPRLFASQSIFEDIYLDANKYSSDFRANSQEKKQGEGKSSEMTSQPNRKEEENGFNIRQELKELNVDGVSNIVRSRFLLLSIVWSLILIASASICLWLVVETFTQYYKRQVFTISRLLHENSPPFPTLTICMSNPFNTDFAAQKLAAANITGLSGQTEGNFIALEELNLNSSEQVQQMTSFEKILLFCGFMGESCVASDFTYMYHPF